MSAEAAAPQVWVQPTGAALAADVHGVNLSRPLDHATEAKIAQAWADHLVLRFSGQRLTDAHLIGFSRRFGDLDDSPGYRPDSDRPEQGRWIAAISNIVEDGRAIGALGYGEAAWHTDMSYNPTPPRASVLYALECPPAGGATSFANMYDAYEELAPDLRARIAGLTCIHDSSRDSTGRLREGFRASDDPRDTPGAHHPLVRIHPVTQRTCLFLGRRVGAHVPGLAVDDSEALLDALWAHATQDRYVWTQQWRVGDLLMWDNRCVLHRREAFDNSRRRLMHRTQIIGEPVLGADARRTQPA